MGLRGHKDSKSSEPESLQIAGGSSGPEARRAGSGKSYFAQPRSILSPTQHPRLFSCSHGQYLIDGFKKTQPPEVPPPPWVNKQAMGLRTQVIST